MPSLYIVPWDGSGTLKDPYRPHGVDDQCFGSIDLRPDLTKRDGFALVSTSDNVPTLAALKFADDVKDTFGAAVRRHLEVRTGVNLKGVGRSDVLAAVLLRQQGGWKPNRMAGRYEIWLAGDLVWEEPWTTGGALDSFTYSNGELNSVSGGVWVAQAGSGSTLNVSSNGVILVAAIGNGTSYFYSGAAVTADQYAACKQTADGFSQAGPFVRCADTGYSGYGLDPAFNQLIKYVSGSPTLIGGGSLTPDIVAGDLIRVEASGSSIRAILNGVEMTGSPVTDTSLTTAGSGVGIYAGETAAKIDDWEGGDLGGGTVVSSGYSLLTPQAARAGFRTTRGGGRGVGRR